MYKRQADNNTTYSTFKAATAATAGGAGLVPVSYTHLPLTWIVVVIMAVVAAIAIWVNHVGGLRIAWQICVNAVLNAGNRLKLGIMFVV